MNDIKKMIHTFSYIMTGITLSTAIFITVFYPGEAFSISLIWQIIALSAACALGNLIYYRCHSLSKGQMILRIILHYLYINIAVFIFAYVWEWITPGLLPEFLVMLLLVGLVYAIITIVAFRQEGKLAADLNRRLREQFPNREDAD